MKSEPGKNLVIAIGRARAVTLVLLCSLILTVPSGVTASDGHGKQIDHPSTASLVVLGIELGHANLAKVQQRLGKAVVWTQGDASTAEEAACYVTGGTRPLVIVFASNAEMAGPPENDVTDIRLVDGAGYSNKSRCGELAISSGGVRMRNGLKLGLTRNGVEKILGAPETSAGSEWSYSWSVERSLSTSDKHYQYWLGRKDECFDGKSPFYTVSFNIVIQFGGHRVESLSLRRIESAC